jgi:YesN/AraC family two-component response regulator
MMRRYLLVDDEINILHALRRALHQHRRKENVHVEVYTDAQQALVRLQEVSFDLVISDYRMPVMNGIDFLKRAKDMQQDAVRLMLSSSDDFETVLGAINEAEIFRYVTKPWDVVELMKIIELGLVRKDEGKKIRHLAAELGLVTAQLTPEEAELRRLEEMEPGITKVNWGPDGTVLFDFPEQDT